MATLGPTGTLYESDYLKSFFTITRSMWSSLKPCEDENEGT